MPKAYPPGTRRGNRVWIVKGKIAGGDYEIRIPAARDERSALRAWDQSAKAIRARGAVRQRAERPRTFAQVVSDYAAARRISRREQAYLDKLCGAWLADEARSLGDIPIADVLPLHLGRAARVLYPGERVSAATINRSVYTPAAAVLHFAAENRLREYSVVRKLREPEPVSRRPPETVRDILLANTDGPQHALLALLFFQGWRISECLALDWQHVDLPSGVVRLWIPKAGRWKPVALHGIARAALAGLDGPKDAGPVFPWRRRERVYAWLRPLCAELGVTFTPHMARHDFAGRLREHGATDRDLVDVGSWTSGKSVARYSAAPAEHARSVLARLSPPPKGAIR